MDSIPILFYFPYRGVGGVSALFLRMASELKDSHPVYLVDFKDGYIGTRVLDGGDFIECTTNYQLCWYVGEG